MAAEYSPLRGDAEFFTPRGFGYRHLDAGNAGYFRNGVQKNEDSGVPLPRNQVQFAPHTSTTTGTEGQLDQSTGPRHQRDSVTTITGPTGQLGSLATITGPIAHAATEIRQANDRFQAKEDDMYHLLPAFSPFDDYCDAQGLALKTPSGLGVPDDSHGNANESPPPNSTAIFSPFYPNAGESKTRSLLPSFKTTATSTSIWSTDAVAQQSPFSPFPAASEPKTKGDKSEHWQHQALPFTSNGIDNKANNAFSLEGLWDESPFKQNSKKVSPSVRYADFDSPSLMPNGFNAVTFASSTVADDIYGPSLKSPSAIGLGIDEMSKVEPNMFASIPLPPPPGLPVVGSIAGYTNDLLSIKEIEEKMTLLREQSSGLAGDLIQQAARYAQSCIL
jgi:hypothetical protein